MKPVVQVRDAVHPRIVHETRNGWSFHGIVWEPKDEPKALVTVREIHDVDPNELFSFPPWRWTDNVILFGGFFGASLFAALLMHGVLELWKLWT